MPNIKPNSNLYFLWCVPRSRSTAFEKMIAGTKQFKVYGEPFIDVYKLGIKSKKDKAIAQQTFDSIFEELLDKSQYEPIFVKDMGYHAAPFISDSQIASAYHAFLIRDPRYSVPSLYKMREDFHKNETGFKGQVELYDRVQNQLAEQALVMDAEELVRFPDDIVSRYFKSIERPIPDDILNWEIGSRKDWKGRESWHIDAINSSHFFGPKELVDETPVSERVSEIIEYSLPYYKYLRDKT